MEYGEDDVELDQDIQDQTVSVDVEMETGGFTTEESIVSAGGNEQLAPKKKGGRINAAAMGGNAKKRLVQGLVSPRKKAMAKQVSKGGDKGPAPTKKASARPKSEQA